MTKWTDAKLKKEAIKEASSPTFFDDDEEDDGDTIILSILKRRGF